MTDRQRLEEDLLGLKASTRRARDGHAKTRLILRSTRIRVSTLAILVRDVSVCFGTVAALLVLVSFYDRSGAGYYWVSAGFLALFGLIGYWLSREILGTIRFDSLSRGRVD